MHAIARFEFVRPFLWVAAFAFIVGFAGYFAVGGATALAAGHPPSHAATISGPASDAWNLPKEI